MKRGDDCSWSRMAFSVFRLLSSFQFQSIFSASSPIFFHSPWKNLFMSYETIWTVDILYEISKNMKCSREWEVMEGERMFMNTMETESWIYLATSLIRFEFSEQIFVLFPCMFRDHMDISLLFLIENSIFVSSQNCVIVKSAKMCGSTDTSDVAGSCISVQERSFFFEKKKNIDTRPILAEPSFFFVLLRMTSGCRL